ncbi:hypothetical protein [Sansalvadorimonas verongulae]|uniref:hypothetical protein n=1 Tax=Sansalvadorimonas verongulae TaxID=2172824 RepID=UPI0012BB95C4|nr:hypothetical protein [Sansalvadorimonas verongulae]MTI14512.1 hypothetical protein [Sansalvadorimonas verongulae]
MPVFSGEQRLEFTTGAIPAVLALAVSLGVSQWSGANVEADPEDVVGEPVLLMEDQSQEDDSEVETVRSPLILNARLLKGSSGIALEFAVNPWASVQKSSARICKGRSELCYRYDTIPNRETLPLVSHINLKSRADTVSMIKGEALFNRGGTLEEFTLPSDIHADQSGHLVGAVGKAMKVLAAQQPELVSRLGDDNTALIVSDAANITFTIYSSDGNVEPMVEVVIPAKGETFVEFVSEDLQQPLGGKPSTSENQLPKKLNIVGLMVSRKGAIPGAILGYLKDILQSIEYRGLRGHFLKLGMAGEGAWGSMDEYRRRVAQLLERTWYETPDVITGTLVPSRRPEHKALVNRYDGEGRVDLLLTDVGNSEEAEEAEEAVVRIYNLVKAIEAGEGVSLGLTADNLYQVRFILRPEVARELHDRSSDQWVESLSGCFLSKLKSVISPPMDWKEFIDKIIIAKKTPQYVKVKHEDYVRGDSIKEYMYANARAFAAGATVSSTIGTSVRVYDRYRRDGKLPHRYSKAELVKLAEYSARDGLRGGISGTATMNIMKFTGVPAPVAGAAVAATNSLYNAYHAGELSWNTAVPVTVRAGAESMAAAAGGWVGEAAFRVLPFGQSGPMKVSGALAGSLVGHYIYQVAVDRYSSYLPVTMSGKPKHTVLKLH